MNEMVSTRTELDVVEEAAVSHALARQHFDHAVLRAHAAGWSLRQIGNAAMLSHEAVRMILHRYPGWSGQ